MSRRIGGVHADQKFAFKACDVSKGWHTMVYVAWRMLHGVSMA